METIGILSLLPPIIAIALAIITKQVVVSLFAGIWIGATLLASYNPIQGFADSFSEYVFPSMGDSYNASVIFMVFFCGAFSLLLERSGGAQAFADTLAPKVKSRKGAQLTAAAGGTIYFISDSSNPVLIGPIFKPLTDKMKVSREKLAYICDSTTASMPTLFFFTAWGAYISSIVAEEFKLLDIKQSVTSTYVSSAPFMVYIIIAVSLVWIISFTGWDFGPMKRAEERAWKTGELVAKKDQTKNLLRKVELPEDAKPTIWNMIIPIVALLITIFTCFLWTGGFPKVGALEALGNANSMLSLVIGFLIGAVVCAFMCVKSKALTLKGAVSTFFEGISQMTEIALILTLAWGIGSVCKGVGTTAFVINTTESFMTPTLLFVSVFVISAATAFATGTSWGTFAIYLPLAIPMAVAIGAPVEIAIGTVVSGGIFGDHCSPISDTTILSSMGASCDHIAHVRTQLPYALIGATATAVSYLISGQLVDNLGMGLTSAIGIIIALVIAVIILFICKNIFNKGYEDGELAKEQA